MKCPPYPSLTAVMRGMVKAAPSGLDARTVADLAGKQLLDEEALLEALQYRAQEKVETF